ncbi:centrosomal protein of 41 kda [Stylonychia lemnae]|uniref:Centrosomal protein of 41 kDa n=1 Tax=Stylonychia lemnae TaxID=5949 RepID=A0A078ATF7_STYLE|nr:centrosomal protein of 41 kda [Stylonychia lemnae]|eukprot:CDW84457.1 centrosomal protein of 41 kda [Stylonychia lemnae]
MQLTFINKHILQLDKKINKTKKYDHVQSQVSHGKTVKDVEVLTKLLGGINFGESVYQWRSGEEGKEEFKASDMITDTESIYSMRTDMTQKTSVTVATDQLGITADTQFLLLDMREPEQYRKWHIRDSINYYHILLNQDKTIPELYRFRNQPNKMIIIYLEDERIGTEIATKMVEKGIENSFLLSGGIEKFHEEFTDLVEGNDVPVPQKKIKEDKDKSKQLRKTQVKMRHNDCKKD